MDGLFTVTSPVRLHCFVSFFGGGGGGSLFVFVGDGFCFVLFCFVFVVELGNND